MNRLDLTLYGGGQVTSSDTIYLKRGRNDTYEFNRDSGDSVRHPDIYKEKRCNHQRRERRRRKHDTESEGRSDSDSADRSSLVDDAPLRDKNRMVKNVIPLNTLLERVMDYDKYNLNDSFTYYDTLVANE